MLTWDLNHVADFRAAPSRPSISKLKSNMPKVPQFHTRPWDQRHFSTLASFPPSTDLYPLSPDAFSWCRIWLTGCEHRTCCATPRLTYSLSTASYGSKKQHGIDIDVACVCNFTLHWEPTQQFAARAVRGRTAMIRTTRRRTTYLEGLMKVALRSPRAIADDILAPLMQRGHLKTIVGAAWDFFTTSVHFDRT